VTIPNAAPSKRCISKVQNPDVVSVIIDQTKDSFEVQKDRLFQATAIQKRGVVEDYRNRWV